MPLELTFLLLSFLWKCDKDDPTCLLVNPKNRKVDGPHFLSQKINDLHDAFGVYKSGRSHDCVAGSILVMQETAQLISSSYHIEASWQVLKFNVNHHSADCAY